MQGKDAHAMIAGVADKQVAGADGDAMGTFQLSRPASRAAETGNRHKAAFTGIETFQLRIFRIEEIDAAVGPERDIARRREPAEAAAAFRQGTLRVRRRRHYQRSLRAELLQFGGAPANPPVEEQRGRIVRRPRNRRQLTESHHVSGLETVTHVDLMFGGEQQSGFVDGHIGARRNFLAVEHDHETALRSRLPES